MTLSTRTIELMVMAGLSGQSLLDVIRSVEADYTKKRSAAAERQARYRDKKRDSDVTESVTRYVTSSVTNDANVTPLARVEDNNNLPSLEGFSNLPLSPSKPKSSAKRTEAGEPEDFAAFMAIYPRRNGSIDRKSALKAWGPAKKRADVETIMAGAKRYASEMTAKGKVGTEFVKLARTWLNGDGWTEYQTVSQPLTSVPKMARIIEDSPAFVAWTKHMGKRPMVTEARVDGVIRRVAYVTTEFPPAQDTAA